MRVKIKLILLVVVVLLSACGKQAGNDAGGAVSPGTPAEIQTESIDPDGGPELVEDGDLQEQIEEDGDTPVALNSPGERIKIVTLLPANIFAKDRLTVSARLTPGLGDNESLSYVFWVNGKEFSEQIETSIAPFSYAKGDTLFVDVLLHKEENLVERKRSDLLVVGNSRPQIEEVVFPEIRGHGTYTIKVQAKDPDNDTLKYHLEGNPGIPMGMEIDEFSGDITYKITEVPTADVKFKVVVLDNDGGEDWRELVINFTTPEKENR